MNSPSKQAASSHEINELEAAFDRRQLVQRIAASRHFEKAHRLRDFLLYVCERSIENHPEEVTEQQIGVRVFGRPPDYNASEDSIVRSQARLLRMKLESYFHSEGRDEPVVIRIPKGSYLPVFEPRVSDAAAATAPPRGIPWVPILATACGLLLALAGYLAYRLERVPKPPDPPRASVLLWSRMFGGGLPTMLIVPDNTYAMQLEAAQKPGTLGDYLRRAWPESRDAAEIDRILPNFKARRYTTTDAVTAAARLSELAPQFGGSLRIRYARDLTLTDLSLGHLVMIGRPTSNPWVDSFFAGLNYRIETDLATHLVYCRNFAPQPGEPDIYRPAEDGGQRTVYAVAAFRSNGKRGSNVIVISGVNSGSQESALEFLSNPRLFGGLAERLMAESGGAELPYFEVLIRTTTIDGASREPAVVGYRRLRE